MASPTRYNPDPDTLRTYNFRPGKFKDDWVFVSKSKIIRLALLPECSGDFWQIWDRLPNGTLIPQQRQSFSAPTREHWMGMLPDFGYS